MFLYQCEDTLESIFTAIYRVYEEHRDKDEVMLVLDKEPRLFAIEIPVVADRERSEKVARSLCGKFGIEDYERICLALASTDAEKAQAVYRTVVSGLNLQGRSSYGRLFENLGDAEVCKAFKLSRNAGRECCHLEGFLRFEELEGKVLYAQVEPENNLLTFLMAHFSNRFPEENFLIHDVGRRQMGIHKKQEGLDTWFTVDVSEMRERPQLRHSMDEGCYQELFRCFCKEIGIQERENAQLQRNLLPLHFRKYMTEF